jgi:hypothetical protein
VGRLKQIKVTIDPLTEARLMVRAEEAGSSLSEYVRDLIHRSLSQARSVDAVAPRLLELGLVTGILVRAQLGRAVGEDEARIIESRAREKASEQLESLLASGAESSD